MTRGRTATGEPLRADTVLYTASVSKQITAACVALPVQQQRLTGPVRPPHPPGAAPTGPQHPAALSLGDGGVWSTAPDLLRWNDALDRDDLGVSALLQTPGHLDDGTPLSYAWALDVRTHAGARIYRHGGRWAGLSSQLVRIAGRPTGFVIIALDADEDRTAALTTAVLEELTRRHALPCF